MTEVRIRNAKSLKEIVILKDVDGVIVSNNEEQVFTLCFSSLDQVAFLIEELTISDPYIIITHRPEFIHAIASVPVSLSQINIDQESQQVWVKFRKYPFKKIGKGGK